MKGPSEAYRDLVASGDISEDPAQEAVAMRLDALHDALKGYRVGKRGLFGRRRPAPRGIYIYGDVGRGKSLLMDLFFAGAPARRKRRVHFHEFMQEIHGWIARWRNTPQAQRQKDKAYVKGAGDDPIRPAARAVARSAALLCFDEFHIVDIADAMILGRLFEALMEEGVIMVATSNFAPDDLYKDGVNRQLFEPFIALMNERLDIVHLEAATDYRLERLAGAPVYYTPLGRDTDFALDMAWKKLTCGAKPKREVLTVKGRKLVAPCAAFGAARFTAHDLIGKPLGPADYLALAGHFHTLFIERIRKMNADRRDEARRFMTLIDALYEHRVKLVATAEAPPYELYTDGPGADEFARTASRLIEMQSRDYLASAHRIPAIETD